MYEELAHYDFEELTQQLATAFYNDCFEHAATLMQEIQWRLENHHAKD